MEKNLIKTLFSFLVIGFCIIWSTFAATTQKWWEIFNQLKEQWWSDWEIMDAIKDLGYNPNDFFSWWFIANITNTSSQISQELINKFRNDWRSDSQIKKALQDLWYDPDKYFSSDSVVYQQNYTCRSCKTYNIEYSDSLWVYTSSDLKNKEYFINIDYLKRYIDSKNSQKSGCPSNNWRISTSYIDWYNRNDRYIAPNWKVYFITEKNGLFYSSELNTSKNFSSLQEIRYYIRDRNPLIWM